MNLCHENLNIVLGNITFEMLEPSWQLMAPVRKTFRSPEKIFILSSKKSQRTFGNYYSISYLHAIVHDVF